MTYYLDSREIYTIDFFIYILFPRSTRFNIYLFTILVSQNNRHLCFYKVSNKVLPGSKRTNLWKLIEISRMPDKMAVVTISFLQ